MAIPYHDFTKLFNNNLCQEIVMPSSRRGKSIYPIWKEGNSMFTPIHRDTGYTSYWALNFDAELMSNLTDEPAPVNIFNIINCVKHLPKHYVDFILTNMRAANHIYEELSNVSNSDEVLGTKIFARILSINALYKHLGKPFNMPTKLSTKYNKVIEEINKAIIKETSFVEAECISL